MKTSIVLILICLVFFSLVLAGCNPINQNKPLQRQNVSPSPSPSASPSPSSGLISPSPSVSPSASPAK